MERDFLKPLEESAQKATDFLSSSLAAIHTGRASVNLIDEVVVDAYGTKSPLKQIANITVTDPRSMAVQPWDKGNLVQIESALRDSGLSFGVVNSGDVIRVNIPELTQERREQFVKLVKEKAEEAKISVRNGRHDVLEDAKKKKAQSEISEDEMYYREGEINKFVDKKNAEIDAIVLAKEKELREV